jgi:hypothetical protein
MPVIVPTTSPFITTEALRYRAGLVGRQPLGDEVSVQSWIAELDPHITGTVQDQLTTAAVNRESERLLRSGLPDDLITVADISCIFHNAVPETLRGNGFNTWPALKPEKPEPGDTGGQGTGDGPPPGLPQAGTPTNLETYWWGWELYVSHQSVLEITGGEKTFAAIFALLAAAIPGPAHFVLGAAAGALAVQIAWLTWADAHCNGGGAYLDETWAALGAPWIRTVC